VSVIDYMQSATCSRRQWVPQGGSETAKLLCPYLKSVKVFIYVGKTRGPLNCWYSNSFAG